MPNTNPDLSNLCDALQVAQDAVNASHDYTARDWQAFFAALAEFAAALLPLILQFFAARNKAE